MRYCLPLIALAATLRLLAPGAALAADDREVHVTDVVFSEVTRADFDAGWKYRLNHIVQWQSQSAWRMLVSSTSPSLGYSNDGQYAKPLSDLEFKLSTQSGWKALQFAQDQLVTTGTPGPGPPPKQGSLFMDWRVRLRWTHDRPGHYDDAILTFTITQN